MELTVEELDRTDAVSITMELILPKNAEMRAQLFDTLKMLGPYAVAMSTEGDMAILECLENDDDMDEAILERARQQAKATLKLTHELRNLPVQRYEKHHE
jgi:hypothetical protein